MARRIVQFIESGGPGGAEHVMLSLASHLMQRGNAVLAVPPYDGYVSARCRDLGLPCLVLETNRRLDLSLVGRLRRAVSNFGADLIHAHGLDAGVYASLAGLGRVPILMTLHGSVELQRGGPFRLWAKRRILRWSGATMVTVSHYLRNEVVARGFLDPERVFTVHNGVDFASGERSVESDSLRCSLGIPDSVPVVGTVANARQEKGYARFLRAAAKISRFRPDVRFVIAGRIRANTEAKVRNLVETNGLEKHVHLLGFRPDIQRVIEMLDVLVLASDSEGFSLVTVEAMALEKPVVATRCGGPEEIIEDSKTGLLVEIDGGDAIADRVLWLLRHPVQARSMGQRGAESVRERFDISRMVTGYERRYDQLIRKKEPEKVDR